MARNDIITSNQTRFGHESSNSLETTHNSNQESVSRTESRLSPAPAGQKIPLYDVAHSRAGDKGDDLNLSVIPHYPPDIERLKMVIIRWLFPKRFLSTTFAECCGS
ncbi:hypothetical protein OROMI_017554 [Orobanche minor]